MKHIHSLVLIAFALVGLTAQGEPLSIACYGADQGLSVYVDNNVKRLAVHYTKPGLDLGFISTPSSWGEHASYTTIEKSADRLHVVVQVISGAGEEFFVFDSSIELEMKFNADTNHYYVESLELYRLGEKVDTLPFSSEDTCYVQ